MQGENADSAFIPFMFCTITQFDKYDVRHKAMPHVTKYACIIKMHMENRGASRSEKFPPLHLSLLFYSVIKSVLILFYCTEMELIWNTTPHNPISVNHHILVGSIFD